MNKHKFVLLFVFLIFGYKSYCQSDNTSPLDGMVFEGSMGEQGSEEAKWEELISFEKGKMVSSACKPFGFENGDFSSKSVKDVINFTATCTSKEEGKLTWQGSVKNGLLNATYIWDNGQGEQFEYWVKCKEVEKK